ncbi:MAG: hypothetical protein J1G07_01590 [Clostridiales bacterium]|nr:hypothetical protein [Clostridiales bacterium]
MRKLIVGLLVLVCTACGALFIAACAYEETEHNWSTKWSNNDRNHWRECLDDDCSLRTDLSAHDWVLSELIADPTCDQPGSGAYECSVCKRKKDDVVPATGEHIWREFQSRAPSCWLDGYTIRQCALCLKEESTILPATGEHDFDQNTWVGSSLGHYHPCKQASNGCGAVTQLDFHVKSETPSKTVPAGKYTDGRVIYNCTLCDYEVDYDILPATATPVSLEPHFVPNYDPFEGAPGIPPMEVWWKPGEPEAVVTYDEATGEYYATLYQDSGFGSPPTYPYELKFKGISQSGETTDIEIWSYGSTHGINVYLYNADYESKSPITWEGTNLNYTYTNDGGGKLRIRDEGTYTLKFVYEIGDVDRESVVEKCEVTVHVTVVPYPDEPMASGYIALVLDTTPVLYIDSRRNYVA